MSVELKYNNTAVTPAPLITSIRRSFNRTESGENIGCSYIINLAGTITDFDGGIADVISKKQDILDLFNCDANLEIVCDLVTIFSACCRVISVNFDQSIDNMVFTLPYTIELETNSISGTTCCIDSSLQSLNESWEFVPDVECNFFNISGILTPQRTINIVHSVSASAKDSCLSGDAGWLVAKNKVDSLLGWNTDVWNNTNISKDCVGNYSLFNHSRTNNINISGGEYAVTESWALVQNTGSIYPTQEDFTVTIEASRESRLKNVSIQGTIIGYEAATFSGDCVIVNTGKYDNALDYWDNISGTLHARCQTISGFTLTPIYTNFSHTHSPKAGQITYSASFDSDNFCLSAPTGCTILNELIDITDNYPADVYAELQILGRPCPILQCLGIKTKGSKTISASLVVDCGKLCPGDTGFLVAPTKPTLDDLISDWYDYLTGQYDSVYTDNDQESWNPKTGAYNRVITFSFADCCTGTL